MPQYMVSMQAVARFMIEAESEAEALNRALADAPRVDEERVTGYHNEELWVRIHPDEQKKAVIEGVCHSCGVVLGPHEEILCLSCNALVPEACGRCGEPLYDGEGYDGLCGTCADKEDP
jgi:hypothetical protein